MSIARAKTNPYGPATLDIQIEQGADFYLPLTLTKGGIAWSLSGCTLEAHFSPTWSPDQSRINLEVTVVSPSAGTVKVKFSSANSLGLLLPNQPKKSVNPSPFTLGNWVLNITDPSITDEPTKRLIDGIVYLDRDPCLT